MTTGGEEWATDARLRVDAYRDDRRRDFIADLTRRIVRQHELAERHARVFREHGSTRTERPPVGAPTTT